MARASSDLKAINLSATTLVVNSSKVVCSVFISIYAIFIDFYHTLWLLSFRSIYLAMFTLYFSVCAFVCNYVRATNEVHRFAIAIVALNASRWFVLPLSLEMNTWKREQMVKIATQMCTWQKKKEHETSGSFAICRFKVSHIRFACISCVARPFHFFPHSRIEWNPHLRQKQKMTKWHTENIHQIGWWISRPFLVGPIFMFNFISLKFTPKRILFHSKISHTKFDRDKK